MFCDNISIKNMVNNLTSGCRNCMYLIRMLTLNNLKFNRRVFVKYLQSKKNKFADALLRLKVKHFFKIAPTGLKRYPEKLAPELWLPSKLWQC